MAASPDAVDTGTPRVEIARTKDGTRTWRIVAPAEDGSEAALSAAEQTAIKIDERLTERYGNSEG